MNFLNDKIQLVKYTAQYSIRLFDAAMEAQSEEELFDYLDQIESDFRGVGSRISNIKLSIRTANGKAHL